MMGVPPGSLGAITFTGVLVFAIIFTFGATISREELQQNYFVEPLMAWPLPMVVQIAIVLASAGAGLCTLASAPLILTAIAADFQDRITVLERFALKHEDDEPRAALLLSWVMVAALVCLGNLDYVAPIITQVRAQRTPTSPDPHQIHDHHVVVD